MSELEFSHTITPAKTEAKGLPEASCYWGLTYLYVHVLQKESEVGFPVTCKKAEVISLKGAKAN